jgi:U3 small nucleolar RNA-associated protein MPP10
MALSSALSTPWGFLRPTNDLHTAVVDSAKHILDSLAGSVVDAQTTRRQINKKRKRSDLESDSVTQLQLKNLYVDGFTSNQIWEQATRILESTGEEVERDITLIAQHSGYLDQDDSELEETSDPELAQSDSDSQEGMLEDLSEGSGAEDDLDGESGMESEALAEEDDDMDEDMEEWDEDKSVASEEEAPEIFVEDKFGLNDGFFSIDDFNKQSEALERQDVKGGPEEGEDSDEEDLDWHSNPLMAGNAAPVSNGDTSKNSRRQTENEDKQMDDSEEEGPTFGNVDLNADSDSEDEDAEGLDDEEAAGWVNTSDIKYADFFAPPPRKASNKKARALPKTQPDAVPVDDADVDRAMADVRRDLFDEEEDSADGEDDELDEAGDSNAPKSSHEKQKARIADEIRRLEAANVAKKEWMLAGEARAVQRPVNSLIEEDLDFERIGKPVPVVTNETTEDIEELVKRRILAMEFDEVVRRRPGAESQQPGRKPRFELDDTKPQQGLAEMYETEHLKANDPNFVDTKDRKLMREHAEITSLWNDVSAQLDTLCNWHYKPKIAQASINVVTDAPTIMMEEARPTAGGAAGGHAGLAPQEIYAPGDDGRIGGEVVLKNGASISKEEMSREEKAKNRRQDKKTQKKANAETSEQKPGKAAEKQQMMSDLKKGGVKVIGKDGRVTDINGDSVQAGAKTRGDNLKL